MQQAEAGKSGQGGIKAVREGADPGYAVGSNVFVAVRPGCGILVSPKLEEIDDASRVMDGKALSFVEKAVFSEYPVLPGGFSSWRWRRHLLKMPHYPPRRRC